MRCLMLLLVLALHTAGAQRVNTDPNAARFVTDDIARFWRAYDARDSLGSARAFDELYFNPASPGLKNFDAARIHGADNLAKVVAARPVYYASIRESTGRISAQGDAMRASFHRLKALYPPAVFPDVYFVVGALNSGGTTGRAGLLIGAEMYGRTTDEALVNMGAWHRDVLAPVERLPAIVAHELCHYQQRNESQSTLLARSLREGMCDFVGELISGLQLTAKAAEYGRAHEHDLWIEFTAKMNERDVTGWLYGGTTQEGRPADLGYWMGYAISKAYYDRASDKTVALTELFTSRDAKKILALSQYAP